ELRQGGEKVLEGLQIRGAAKEVVQNFVLNVRHQLDEHVVGLGLVLNQRILLRVAAEVNAFPQRIHRVQMLLPESIDRVQNDVSLETLDRRRLLVTRFALIGVLDSFDQE